jgi:hypothetical protein
MTGLVRKAMLFGVCGLLAASAALANVPDPNASTVPTFLYAVGILSNTAAPDFDGADGPSGTSNIIIIKDTFGNPISNVGVHITLPCDFNLCNTAVAGQTVSVGPPCKLNGVTDAAGRWVFAIVGAAKQPSPPVVPCGPPGCVFPGGRLNDTKVEVDGYAGTFKTTTTISLDQDGSSGVAGTNGCTAGDASKVLNESLAYSLGGATATLYRGRSDHNASGTLSAADASAQLAHALRIGIVTGGGVSTCTTTFCANKPACP